MKTRSRQLTRATKYDEKDDLESSNSSTGSLSETEIQLLNAAGISVLNDISHEEKVEILKAISESSRGPKENIHGNEEDIFISTCSDKMEISDSQQVSKHKMEDNLNHSRIASSNQITSTSFELEQKQNSKTGIEKGGEDQISSEDLTSCFVGIKDGTSNLELLVSEPDSTFSCMDCVKTTSHDVVISDNSSKTLPPLFKSEVHKRQHSHKPCINTKPCKSTSMWSFFHLSNNRISPDQYTEVVKHIFDIYFKKLYRKQIEICGVVNKWGKPVLPGPHVDGCLVSNSKKTRKYKFNVNSDSSDEEDIIGNVKNVPKCQELIDISNICENKLFHCTEEDKEIDNTETIAEASKNDFVKNEKPIAWKDPSFKNQSAVEEKPCRKLRLSKRKSLFTASDVNKSIKKRFLGKEDTFSDHSPSFAVSREVMENKKSSKVKDKERTDLYVWSCDDSSDESNLTSKYSDELTGPQNRSLVHKGINDEMEIDDREKSLIKKNSIKTDILTDISVNIQDEIVSERTDEMNVDEFPNLFCKRNPATTQDSNELPDIELSQESCMSNSQSSNSLLDINGYIYSTQITGRKRKLIINKTLPCSSKISATGGKIASETLHDNCKGYSETKHLKVKVDKITFENVTEKHHKDPAFVCNDADPNLLKDDCVEARNKKATKKQKSSDISHKNRKKFESVTSRRCKKNTKSPPDSNMSNNSLLQISGDCSRTVLMEPEILCHSQNVCPICGKNFKQEDIEEHASACGEEYKDPNLKCCNFCHCEMTAEIIDEHETKCISKSKRRAVPSRLTRSSKAGTSPFQKGLEPLLVSDSEDDGELIIEVEPGTQ